MVLWKIRKLLLVLLVAVILVVVAIVVAVVLINKNATKPEGCFSDFISKVNDKNYEEMYNLISESSKDEISEENFITRNKNIYEGIDAYDIKSRYFWSY